MILFIKGHDFHYETENLCRLFFPYERIAVVYGEPEAGDEKIAFAHITETGGKLKYSVGYSFGGASFYDEAFSDAADDKEKERILNVTLFRLLNKVTGITPLWGILTGIHPVKQYRNLCDDFSEEYAEKYFSEKLLVSKEKTELSKKVRSLQLPALEYNTDASFSLYISIPFCPSRCSYCSFVSQTVENSKRLIPEYTEKLLKEIAYTGRIAKDLDLKLESVYIGGGTPTTLEPDELRAVIGEVRNSFDTSSCREFTVEAGRPDTITRDKLKALRECGVRRISINPQTMNDQVLQNIGRRHTSQQTIDAFMLARQEGFDNINMDLIIGLPGDTPESFENTLSELFKLDPENITIHALALKHAAKMMQDDDKSFHKDREAVEKMAEYADKALNSASYEPYYLYRQSRMAGNLENVGWTKQNKSCLYNIYTMEETHTILACGAGGVSKIKSPYSDRLERIFNFKYSYEYVSRFEELLRRKDRIGLLYEEFEKDVLKF